MLARNKNIATFHRQKCSNLCHQGKTAIESRDALSSTGTSAHAAPSAAAKNQLNDLSARNADPTTPPSIQSAKKSSATSSCSNSPSSVRLNQNYEPNGGQKSLAGAATNHINHKAVDTDNSEAADNEPLLQAGNGAAITTTTTKRTNSRYGKADGKSGRAAADSDNENETLIANSGCWIVEKAFGAFTCSNGYWNFLRTYQRNAISIMDWKTRKNQKKNILAYLDREKRNTKKHKK